MKIAAGNYEIFASGSVNSDGLKPTRFSLLDNEKFDVVFELIFNEEKPSIDYVVTADGELTFTFKNPSLMDWGFSAPIKIGHIENRELLVVFRATIHGDKSSYTLNYSFYLGDKSNG